MTKTYRYKAFGVVFESTFKIPELIPCDLVPEITIKTGKTPKTLNRPGGIGVNFQASKNEFLLKHDPVGNYYVSNGNKILVETVKKTIDSETRLFLLGSAFGALFIQRGLIPIHGSAIKTGNSATIFSGPSGAGKSSIAACLIQEGFRILSDDISVINNKNEVAPGYPKMKIWEDVLNKLKIPKTNLLKIRPSMEKFHYPYTENFYNNPLKVKRIIIINSKNTPGFELEQLNGIAKYNAVRHNTYRYRFFEGLNKQQNHFILLNKLLPTIEVFRILRPQAPVALNEFTNFLKSNKLLND